MIKILDIKKTLRKKMNFIIFNLKLSRFYFKNKIKKIMIFPK